MLSIGNSPFAQIITTSIQWHERNEINNGIVEAQLASQVELLTVLQIDDYDPL